MQPSCSHAHRWLTRKALLRSVVSPVLSVLILAALVTACRSSGGSFGEGSSAGGSAGEASSTSLGYGSPSQLSATPPDVPSQAPSCNGSLSQQVSVPSDLANLVSACSDPQGDQMEITNLSEFVLDVAPASGTSSQLEVSSHDTSSDPLPTFAGQLEVEAQNAVVDGWSPYDPEARLLPIGGTATATANGTPVHLTVRVDRQMSKMSFEAAELTSYVVSNVVGEDPSNYYQSIADCVNDTWKLWNQLQEQPPPPAAQLLYQSLMAVGSCTKLRNQVQDYLDYHSQQMDLAAQASRAAQSTDEFDWVSEYAHEEQVQDEIRTDIR
jgi:hypothetical protein